MVVKHMQSCLQTREIADNGLMPVYEYRCPACGSSFEKLRKMQEAEAPADCPLCGSKEASRQLSVCCMSVSGGSNAGPSAGACGMGGGRGFT
jgi:putative FmdB family regulatory protein